MTLPVIWRFLGRDEQVYIHLRKDMMKVSLVLLKGLLKGAWVTRNQLHRGKAQVYLHVKQLLKAVSLELPAQLLGSAGIPLSNILFLCKITTLWGSLKEPSGRECFNLERIVFFKPASPLRSEMTNFLKICFLYMGVPAWVHVYAHTWRQQNSFEPLQLELPAFAEGWACYRIISQAPRNTVLFQEI